MSRAKGQPNRDQGSRSRRRAAKVPTFKVTPTMQLLAAWDRGRPGREAQAEHVRLNKVREKGLIVPPTAAEAAALREAGHKVGAGGLIVP